MLRLIGMVCVVAGAVQARPPAAPPVGQGKELTPMEREHYAPDRTPEKPDQAPATPPAPRPSKHGTEMAGIKFGPLMPRPLGLAPMPGPVVR